MDASEPANCEWVVGQKRRSAVDLSSREHAEKGEGLGWVDLESRLGFEARVRSCAPSRRRLTLTGQEDFAPCLSVPREQGSFVPWGPRDLGLR